MHYISMSQPMVLAMLSGSKSVTRRLPTRFNSLVDGRLASKAEWDALDWSQARVDPGPSPAGNPGPYYKVPTKDADPGWRTTHRVYPRIQPGDTLLFREALENRGGDAVYSADGAQAEGYWCWKPRALAARFCPRWAIRLRGEVVSVTPSTPGSVTTAEEALSEGLMEHPTWPGSWTWRGAEDDPLHDTPADAYRALWLHVGHDEWTPDAACWRIEWR